MKKLLLLALTAIMMAGCCNTQKKETECDKTFKERWHGFHVEVIDSCEYILRYTERESGNQGFGQSFMAHKGDCKYCAERRKKELKELVEQLKGGEQ